MSFIYSKDDAAIATFRRNTYDTNSLLSDIEVITLFKMNFWIAPSLQFHIYKLVHSQNGEPATISSEMRYVKNISFKSFTDLVYYIKSFQNSGTHIAIHSLTSTYYNRYNNFDSYNKTYLLRYFSISEEDIQYLKLKKTGPLLMDYRKFLVSEK